MNIDFNKDRKERNHIISGSSLLNFFRVLADNKFDIDRRFLPKLIQSFLIIFISTPNRILESLIYNRKIRKQPVNSPIFILGYPRSGTTFLVYLLSKDKRFAFSKTYECLGPHVIFVFGKVLRSISRKALPKKRPMDNMEMGATLPKEEEFAIGNMGLESMAHALYFPKKSSEYVNRFVLFNGKESEKRNWKTNHKFFLQKVSYKNIGRQLLLKSPFDTGRVKEILEVYPDAKFIHIYRNPFSVYASNEKLFEGVLPQTAFHTLENDVMEKHLFYSYKATYQKYFQDKTFIPNGNLIEFSYEEFVGSEMKLLEKIYKQLNLADFLQVKETFEKELQRQQHYQTNKHNLSAGQEQKIAEEWKFAFEKFGYR
jgi:omega-hydroxy-beta-dihydromenaquinone-9 sulfotransferase